jgi:hypothetical protein
MGENTIIADLALEVAAAADLRQVGRDRKSRL